MIHATVMKQTSQGNAKRQVVLVYLNTKLINARHI